MNVLKKLVVDARSYIRTFTALLPRDLILRQVHENMVQFIVQNSSFGHLERQLVIFFGDGAQEQEDSRKLSYRKRRWSFDLGTISLVQDHLQGRPIILLTLCNKIPDRESSQSDLDS